MADFTNHRKLVLSRPIYQKWLKCSIRRHTGLFFASLLLLTQVVSCISFGESPPMASPSPTLTPIPEPTPPANPTANLSSPGWTTYAGGNQVYDLLFDQEGYLWAASEGGMTRWDPNTGHYTRYTRDNGLINNRVRSMAIADDGSLWFGTYHGGVSRFDGESWTNFTREEGLVHNSVRSITVAPDGTLWFGTENGVSHFDGQAWTAFSIEGRPGPQNVVYDVAVGPDEALWFGTMKGVWRFDGTSWNQYTAEDGLAASDVWAIAVAVDGSLWFGGEKAVSHFDGNTWASYPITKHDLEYNELRAIYVTSDGTVWIGTYLGAAYLDDCANWRVVFSQVMLHVDDNRPLV